LSKILAIESTGKISSVCAYDLVKKNFLGEINLNIGYSQSENLLVINNDLLKVLNIDIKEISYIACSQGPGSFTGIKIGCATSKALAHALGINIISVNTLDSMVQDFYCNNFYFDNCLILPLIDSRRSEVFTALYELNNNKINKISDFLNIKIIEALNLVIDINNKNNRKKKILVFGDAVKINIDLINEIKNKNKKIYFFDFDNRKAINVLKQSLNYLEKNINIFRYDDFLPFYLRKHELE
jgi:tRNA threonylcarbamoyladenosine biosynthesis protein TsaB